MQIINYVDLMVAIHGWLVILHIPLKLKTYNELVFPLIKKYQEVKRTWFTFSCCTKWKIIHTYMNKKLQKKKTLAYCWIAVSLSHPSLQSPFSIFLILHIKVKTLFHNHYKYGHFLNYKPSLNFLWDCSNEVL